ncbi:MAG: TraR/DksA C4-type zinc finger protein [Candidatus Paceibacterota bacterium]
MDKQNLEELKNKLKEEKKNIALRIKRLAKIPDFGSDVDSLEEESDESEEYGNQLSVAQVAKNRLADINSALLKIEKDKYGICEKCKKEISLELLKVNPESRLCKNCKRLSINSKAAGK